MTEALCLNLLTKYIWSEKKTCKKRIFSAVKERLKGQSIFETNAIFIDTIPGITSRWLNFFLLRTFTDISKILFGNYASAQDNINKSLFNRHDSPLSTWRRVWYSIIIVQWPFLLLCHRLLIRISRFSLKKKTLYFSRSTMRFI